MKTTRKQRRATYLIYAFLHHNARPEFRPTAWLYLMEWAAHGGTTSEVPSKFGGSGMSGEKTSAGVVLAC